MEKIRIYDILEFAVNHFPNKPDLLAAKVNGEWQKYSPLQYKRKAEEFAISLLELGIKKGDKIATITNSRPEWNFVDMGSAMIGAVHVPIYPTLTPEDFEYILIHSDTVALFVSDLSMYKKLKPIFEKIDNVRFLYTFNDLEGTDKFSDLLVLGSKKYDERIEELNKLKAENTPDDVVTLIYTSGTTGKPKGVMLSHWNFVYQAYRAKILLPFDSTHKSLSFLPLCHVYERMINLVMQFLGVSIYYAEGLHTIAENLVEVEPHFFTTVPRVLERFYDKIVAKGNMLSGIKRKLFFDSIKHAENYNFEHQSFIYKAKQEFYNNLIFSQWRKSFGGKVMIVIAGGSAMPKRLSKIFWAAGICVTEGYGLSETAPVICLNNIPPKPIQLGSVGKPLGPEQLIKINDDGEILFKGPTIMKGYYKDNQLTQNVIDNDGWFHTGDIGKIDEEGYLYITGRKKEIFKLSTGKYITPSPIEDKLTESSYIENAMVVGENQKFAGALIAPNFELLHELANQKKLTFRDNKDLVRLPEVVDLIKTEIVETNRKLAQYERINTFKIVCQEWTPASGELSVTLKKRRHILYDKYKFLIDQMYPKNNFN